MAAITVWEAVRIGESLPSIKLYFEKYGVALPSDLEVVERRTGYTLLHLAAELGRADLIQYLTGNLVNTEALDHQGRTPLHVAVTAAKAVSVQALLKGLANMEEKGRINQTAPNLCAQLIRDGRNVRALRIIAQIFEERQAREEAAVQKICEKLAGVGQSAGAARRPQVEESSEEEEVEESDDVEESSVEESSEGEDSDDVEESSDAENEDTSEERASVAPPPRTGGILRGLTIVGQASTAQGRIVSGMTKRAEGTRYTYYKRGEVAVKKASLREEPARKPKRYITSELAGSNAAPAWEKVYDFQTRRWIDTKEQRRLSKIYDLIPLLTEGRNYYYMSEKGKRIYINP